MNYLRHLVHLEHLRLKGCTMLNDDLEKKRKELELMLSVEHQMSDTSKNRLILKLLDLLEDEIELD